jgi:Family of unknown function (DUF5329)
MKMTTLFLAALITGSAAAAEPSPADRKGIEHLFARLESSGCQFFRNGSWHSAKDASSHLRQKYKYLLDKGVISTAESFIEQGAATSSVSGKPYQVHCGGDAKPEPSAMWFKAELAKYRQSAK